MRRSDPRAGRLQGLPAGSAGEGGMPLPGLQSRLRTGRTTHPRQWDGAGEASPGAAPASPGWDCRVRDPHCRCTRSARRAWPCFVWDAVGRRPPESTAPFQMRFTTLGTLETFSDKLHCLLS